MTLTDVDDNDPEPNMETVSNDDGKSERNGSILNGAELSNHELCALLNVQSIAVLEPVESEQPTEFQPLDLPGVVEPEVGVRPDGVSEASGDELGTECSPDGVVQPREGEQPGDEVMGTADGTAEDTSYGFVSMNDDNPLNVLDVSFICTEERAECIRREVPVYNGIYVDGELQGLEVTYTVDTGASTSIVSSKLFRQIPTEVRPKLHNVGGSAKGAGGNPIRTWGVASFEITLGPVCITRNLVVADITDEILLGHDLIRQDELGPMDIMNSRNKLIFGGQEIPFHAVGESKRPIRVLALEDIRIPGMCERVVDVYLDRVAGSEPDRSNMMIEGHPYLETKYNCAIPPTLVDPTGKISVQVRIINPFPEHVLILGDTLLGMATEVDVGHVVLEQEDPGSEGNFCTTRRILAPPVTTASVPGGLVRNVKATEDDPVVPEYLTDLSSRSTAKRSKYGEEKTVKSLLSRQKRSFSENTDHLGLTHLVEHCIDTGDAVPIKQPPRRVPMSEAENERLEIVKLKDRGVIRPSMSPWASPLVMVRKKDGSSRLCVDFRRLNLVTRDDAFPLPRIQDCLDAVAGSTIFSTMDITAAYHQVPVREEDIPKTAFITKYGLYEFTSLPFGLKTAPATFQRLMELALCGLQWTSCLIYLDDVIVFSPDFDSHVERLESVLQRLGDAGLKLKPDKCHFFQDEVKFLGHILSAEGVLPDPDNVAKILDWPTPKCVSDVRSILGLGNYYRRFVKEFSEKMLPLTNLTRKDVVFYWCIKCIEAFDLLKQELTGPSIMAYPRDVGLFILDTDASLATIGAVLSQEQDGQERVICYGSRTLCKAERNYCVTDRELLAVRYFVEYYKHYLLGRHFLVRTDHQALKWLISLKEPKERLARWIETLSSYDFSIEYRPGPKHGNADGMSRRCPNPFDCECPTFDGDVLKCGPCKKCQKRAVTMESDLRDSKGELMMRKVQTRSSTRANAGSTGSPTTNVSTNVNVCTDNVNMVCDDVVDCSKVPAKRKKCGRASRKRGGRWVEEQEPGEFQASDYVDQPLQPAAASAEPEVEAEGQKGQVEGSIPKKTTGTAGKGWTLPYSMKDLGRFQSKDNGIAPILEWLKVGPRPKGPMVNAASPATRHYWLSWDSLCLKDGVLFRSAYRKDGTGPHLQLVVPENLQKEVLKQMHDNLLSGHLGKKKTKGRLLQRFYWFGVREDVDLWVLGCHVCSLVKKPPTNPKAPLGSMPVGAPLDRLATDVLGPLPKTPRGNKYILLVTDYFSKWMEIFAVPDQTASTCANIILNEVISRFGCPLDLHSDQGRNYESKIFADLCRLLEIKKTRTSGGNPRCNGMAERFNRTLLKMIKAYLKGQQREWDQNLGCLAAAYRSSPHESTGLTPNLLMLGREVRLPAEVMFGTCRQEPTETYVEYVEKLKQRMNRAHEVARTHLSTAAKRQKKVYDARLSTNTYSPGDLVLMETEKDQLEIAPKLRVPYQGPYMVTKRFNDLDYEVYLGKKYRVVHHNRLKLYNGSERPPWYHRILREARRGT